MAIAQLHNPAFVIQNWYTSLLSILLVTLVTIFNIWGAKKLALAETIFVSLHVACFFIVLITVAVTSPKNDAKDVFLTFSDNGGNYPTCMFQPPAPQLGLFRWCDQLDIHSEETYVLLTLCFQWALQSWSVKCQPCGTSWPQMLLLIYVSHYPPPYSLPTAAH